MLWFIYPCIRMYRVVIELIACTTCVRCYLKCKIQPVFRTQYTFWSMQCGPDAASSVISVLAHITSNVELVDHMLQFKVICIVQSMCCTVRLMGYDVLQSIRHMASVMPSVVYGVLVAISHGLFGLWRLACGRRRGMHDLQHVVHQSLWMLDSKT